VPTEADALMPPGRQVDGGAVVLVGVDVGVLVCEVGVVEGLELCVIGYNALSTGPRDVEVVVVVVVATVVVVVFVTVPDGLGHASVEVVLVAVDVAVAYDVLVVVVWPADVDVCPAPAGATESRIRTKSALAETAIARERRGVRGSEEAFIMFSRPVGPIHHRKGLSSKPLMPRIVRATGRGRGLKPF
jgi:hypothetical protein